MRLQRTVRFLIHDGGGQYTRSFDDVFTASGNERQLRALLGDYVAHYNEHRPHRSLRQRAPAGEDVAAIGAAEPIQRRPTCGGLINEYRTAA